jgi:hypothetical protein
MKTKVHASKKTILIFILVLCISGGLGYALAMGMQSLTGGQPLDLSRLSEALAPVLPWAFVGSNVVLCALSIVLYLRVKAQAKGWDGEDEGIEQVEKQLNYPLLLCNLMMVVNFFFFSASIQTLEFTNYGSTHDILLFPLCLGTFLLGYVWIFGVTNAVVKLERTLNPEKRGSIFELRFQKTWLESCDEAEKLKSYQAGYQGYRAGNLACLVLWVLATLGQLSANTGLFPVVCISVIWLVMVLRSTWEAMKLS